MNNTIYSIDDNDFILANDKHIRNPLYDYQNQRIAYNQSDVHRLSCSLHAVMTVISNITNYYFALPQRLEILEYARKQGFNDEWGWYMQSAVKCVVQYANSHCGLDLLYYRVPHTEYESLTEKGFGVVTGYYYKTGMAGDRKDGTIGNEDIKYGKQKYGHLVSLHNFAKRENQRKEYKGLTVGDKQFGFVDNYYPKHINNETFIDNLENLVNKEIVFRNGYIIIPKKLTKALTKERFKQKLRDMRKFLNLN